MQPCDLGERFFSPPPNAMDDPHRAGIPQKSYSNIYLNVNIFKRVGVLVFFLGSAMEDLHRDGIPLK